MVSDTSGLLPVCAGVFLVLGTPYVVAMSEPTEPTEPIVVDGKILATMTDAELEMLAADVVRQLTRARARIPAVGASPRDAPPTSGHGRKRPPLQPSIGD